MLDSKPAVKSLSFTQATPYISVNPGTHTLGAMRPGDSTPLVPGAHMPLVSGRAYSAIVLGSRGQRVRVVTVTDSGAPLTRHASASSPAKRASAGGPTSVMVRQESRCGASQRTCCPPARAPRRSTTGSFRSGIATGAVSGPATPA